MKNLKYFIPSAIVLCGLLGATMVFANPFYTGSKAQSAAATSTQTYLTPGAATTTPVYDSYEQYGTNEPNSSNITIPNQVAILLQGVASTTSTVVNVACEFSDNYMGTAGSGDWYQNELITPTTTGATLITTPSTYTFTYASSTVGGAPVGPNTARFQKLVVCPVPLRYVRAVITMTGANGSVWAELSPLKQRN